MNARTAIEENTRLIKELFNSAKEFSERKGISIKEAIDFKVSVMINHAKNDTAKCAIELRASAAHKMA